jgi:glycosidase
MHDNNAVNDTDGRNKNRTPMQWNGGRGAGFTSLDADQTWLEIHPNYAAVNLQSQVEQPRSTYKYFQSLTALRKHNAIRKGDFTFTTINEDVFAYTR